MSLFVTFEGPDGAGKSTQTRLVSEALHHAGYRVAVTREPGGTALGERIRELLLGPEPYAIVPQAEALLMTADRAQHVREVIRPALDDGAIVLCDRFSDSTLAYQGAGRNLSVQELEKLQRFAIDDCRPDLTILLDLPADEGLRRRERSTSPLNRLDRDELSFHERVRDWYVAAAADEPERWKVFDALMPPEELSNEIVSQILARVSGAESGSRRDGVSP